MKDGDLFSETWAVLKRLWRYWCMCVFICACVTIPVVWWSCLDWSCWMCRDQERLWNLTLLRERKANVSQRLTDLTKKWNTQIVKYSNVKILSCCAKPVCCYFFFSTQTHKFFEESTHSASHTTTVYRDQNLSSIKKDRKMQKMHHKIFYEPYWAIFQVFWDFFQL